MAFVQKSAEQLNIADYQSALHMLTQIDFHEFSKEIIERLKLQQQPISYQESYVAGVLNAKALYEQLPSYEEFIKQVDTQTLELIVKFVSMKYESIQGGTVIQRETLLSFPSGPLSRTINYAWQSQNEANIIIYTLSKLLQYQKGKFNMNQYVINQNLVTVKLEQSSFRLNNLNLKGQLNINQCQLYPQCIANSYGAQYALNGDYENQMQRITNDDDIDDEI